MKNLWVILLAMYGTSTLAFETTHSDTFYSGGKPVRFLYNQDIVAVKSIPHIDPNNDFAEAGISYASAKNIVSAIGIPVKFPESNGTGIITDRVLVRTESNFQISQSLGKIDGIVSVENKKYGDGIYTIKFASISAAIIGANKLASKPGIIYAHPSFLLPLEVRSNPDAEPYFPRQWHLENTGQTGGTPGSDLNAKAAWAITQGTPETLVAVIDVGFEQLHTDLNAAWFINSGEIPGNRTDDDGNGLKDDVSGWNFATNGTNLVYGQNPAHGTSSSGIIGARANGVGVTGLCPQCKILPIVIDQDVETAVAGFLYAKSFNPKVISNSWGYKIGTPRLDALVDAINQTASNGRNGKGISIVFAMGNSNRNDCRLPEPDISSLESVLAVSSVDHNDLKVAQSAFGLCMDFVAPTSGSTINAIGTTDRPAEKGYNRGENPDDFPDLDFTHTFYGTSAATPQVAAVLALIYAVKPDITSAQAFQLLRDNADKVQPGLAAYSANGHSQTYGYGRINAGKAVQAASFLTTLSSF
jgi:hypothetical protein